MVINNVLIILHSALIRTFTIPPKLPAKFHDGVLNVFLENREKEKQCPRDNYR